MEYQKSQVSENENRLGATSSSPTGLSTFLDQEVYGDLTLLLCETIVVQWST